MPDKPAPPSLTLDLECTNEVIIVHCHGQLISELSDIFYSKIRPIIPGSKRIVLDLANVTRMDSMGLGTLVGLYTSARAAGCEMQLLHVGKRIRELLGLTNLLSVFTIIGEHGQNTEACEREGRSFDGFQHAEWHVQDELAGPYAVA